MLQLNNYPYTNFSELNLDYLLKNVGDLKGLKLVITTEKLQLVDRTGKILSEIDLPFKTGNIEIWDIFNHTIGDSSTLIQQLGTLEAGESAYFVSDKTVTDMVNIMKQGNIVTLRHHTQNSDVLDYVDTNWVLPGRAISADPRDGYINFDYCIIDSETNYMKYMIFNITNTNETEVCITKLREWTDEA